MDSEYVEPRAIYSRLGVSPATLLRWVKQGHFPAPDIKIGRTSRWKRDRAEAAINAMKGTAQ